MKFHLTPGRTVVATLVATSLLLTGCATASSSQEGTVDLVTDKSEISGEITFSTWWSYVDQDVIDGFSKEYPNVDVKLDFTAIDSYPTKLQAKASSGDLPDVFSTQGTTLEGLVKANHLYDLQDALATPSYDLDGNWGETFDEGLLSGATASVAKWEENGEKHAIPFNAISVAAIYNQDIFEEVGVTPATSFDELLSNCRALSDAGYIPMSLTGTVWINWWTTIAWDQTMRDDKLEDFSVDNPNYIKGLELVEEMAEAECWSDSQISTDIAGETALFLQQKTAQFVSVPENFLQSVAEGAKFPISTYTLPAFDGVSPNRALGGGSSNAIAVNANSENVSAAVAFAKYLTSEEVQASLAESIYTIPSIQIDLGSADGEEGLMSAYLDAASQGFVQPSSYMPVFSTPGFTTYTGEVLPSLILGKITAEEAAKQTEGLFSE